MGDEAATKKDLDEFRTFLLQQLEGHKAHVSSQFADASHAAEGALQLSQQLKADSEIKLNHAGNERNFKFNASIKNVLHQVITHVQADEKEKALELLKDATELLDDRNRKIRIADSSEAGWLTVKHYESSPVATDPEDDKRIRSAEREALREKARLSRNRRNNVEPFQGRGRGASYYSQGRFAPQGRRWPPDRPQAYHQPNHARSRGGACRYCGTFGHWWRECPLRNSRHSALPFYGPGPGQPSTSTSTSAH